MTTNEIIQAVLATGELGLPAGIGQAVELGMPVWTLNRSIITQQQAHDLVACEWARKKDWTVCVEPIASGVRDAMAQGDSEAAIHAALGANNGGKQ